MATTTTTPRTPLRDALGRPVRLGREIGRGGEGNVYEIVDVPEFVAKVYHAVADAERSAKLAAMVRGASPALTEIAAWPTTTLHARGSAASAGAPVLDAPVLGLVMPRANGAPVHRLYSPVSRKAEFPNVDWKRLVIVAHNVAAAMARLHEAGHVVGDVNQGNVLVETKGRVRLIDCDSFQIRDGTRWFPCDVGVAHFTPPELQGRSFAGITRTPNHDAFGLAVLVFHLLFMGRHPFAGRYAGTGEMPLEQAIAEFRFAFGRNAGAVQMAPPPNALSLDSASPGVADLFERAFGRDGVRDGARPTAAEWQTALGTLANETVRCAAAPGHQYPRSLGACPWCAIASAGGPDFFASGPFGVRPLAGFNAVEVWTAILAVPAPESRPVAPALPTVVVAPTHPVSLWQRISWQSQGPLGVAAGLALFAGTLGSLGTPALAVALGLSGLFLGLRRGSGLAAEHDRRQRELEAARARLGGIEERWTRELGHASARFTAKREELDALRSEYLDIEPARRRGRQEIERTFRFDPSKGVDAAELAALETRFARRRDEIERSLAAGPAALRQLGDVANHLRGTLAREIGARQVAVAAATANVAAVSGRVLPHPLGALAWAAVAVISLIAGNAVSDRLGRPPVADGGPPIELRSYLAQHRPVAAPARPPAVANAASRTPNGAPYFEFQVEKQAATVPGTLSAAYPQLLKSAPFGGDGKVVAQFVVDPSGHADMRTWKVLESTDALFSQAARDGVSAAQFYPAEIGGKKVRQLVQLPFTFTLSR